MQRIKSETEKREKKVLEFRTEDDVKEEDALHTRAEDERRDTLASLAALQKVQEGKLRQAQEALLHHHLQQNDDADHTVEGAWQEWTCDSDPTQHARYKVHKPSSCSAAIVLATENVDQLGLECSMAFSALVTTVYGRAVLKFATESYGQPGCQSGLIGLPSLNRAAIKLLVALQAEYSVSGPMANATVASHEEAEKLLKRADALQTNVKQQNATESTAHLSNAIDKAKEAMGKVIEAHNEIHRANSLGPALSEKRPWACDADPTEMEPTVHFDKPCDSFISVTSSVGSGVANRFAGVFVLGTSRSPLDRDCRKELSSEVAARFGQSLVDLNKKLGQCHSITTMSQPVLAASKALSHVTASAEFSEGAELGDTNEDTSGDAVQEPAMDMDTVLAKGIADAEKQVRSLVSHATTIARQARTEMGATINIRGHQHHLDSAVESARAAHALLAEGETRSHGEVAMLDMR